MNRAGRIHNRVTQAQLALQVGQWVRITRDNGEEELRVVKHDPWQLGDGTWVIGLVGISGGYALCRCRPEKMVPA